MSTGSAVDAWFADLQHPLKPIMLRVREIILSADGRISELVKYGTVHFECRTGLASFVQVKDPKRVSLMFNAAGKLAGDYPHLEGKSVKYLRFADMADVDARRSELAAITRAYPQEAPPEVRGEGWASTAVRARHNVFRMSDRLGRIDTEPRGRSQARRMVGSSQPQRTVSVATNSSPNLPIPQHRRPTSQQMPSTCPWAAFWL